MRKRAWVIAIGLLSCLISASAFALPDLVVADIRIEPLNPQAGDSVFIEVTVSNDGSDEVEKPFFVHFIMDGQEIAVQSIVGGISSGRSKRVAIEWLALAGLHSLSVEVDPPIERILESNDANNHDSRMISVALNAETAAAIGSLKLVVASFNDFTGTGFLRVGEGVSDKLSDRFLGMGIRVLDRFELESIMQQRELNPFLASDLTLAAQILGADILITGSVSELIVHDSSLQLGILAINSAEANIRLSASLVDVGTSHVLGSEVGEGFSEGTTGFSVDLSGLLGALESGSIDLCGGGLQTAQSWYNVGESIAIAYRNPGAAEWFSIEVTTSVGSFVRWLGWKYIDTNDCKLWNWDQLDTAGFQMSPGIYTAKIWDGIAYVAETSFQIRPGISLAAVPATEITVGTEQFEETVVGNALNNAVDDLAMGILRALESAAPLPAELEPHFGAAQNSMPSMREGQIATILPDGRIAINIGASSGVIQGEIFEVLSVANVVIDPQTHEILDYEVLDVKGRIRITDVRDRVSYGNRMSDFEPVIGDIVRWIAP